MSVPTKHAISPDSGQHWTEPGAWAVAAGVYRIPLPLPLDGLRAVNVYALETDHGLTLIDGGWAIEVSRTLLEKSLSGIGYGVRDITRFLVTHVHRDHYTQASTISKEFGAHVSLGLGDKPTLDLIREPGDLDENPHLQMLRDAGAHDLVEQWKTFDQTPPDLDLWGYPDAWLEDDHPIDVGSRTLQAVSTPGHTQGHFVFADRTAQLLFSGDHVLPTITPSIGFEPVLAAQPLGDFLASLAKVRALPDARLLPAHGPVADSVHTRVDELVAHHDDRLDLCRAGVVATGSTAWQVAGELPWTRHEHRFDTLDVFNGALATLETKAHLELLVARGELTRSDSDAGFVYAPASASASPAPAPGEG